MQTISNLKLHKLLEPETTADVLGVTTGTLQVWRSTGRYNLTYVKVGGRVMYRAEDVQAFIERRLHNHTDDVA
ncbi:MAG: helix-turn-helix domain-containing protein [Sedimenticola sp.]|nr:helix-turn-helix domain-containing protein [Sedimenticola sp.]